MFSAGSTTCLLYTSLLDHTVEGVRSVGDRIASVQYHPESAPGPQDSGYLFDLFLAQMDETKQTQEG